MAVAERWPLVEVRLYSIDYKHKSNLSKSKLRLLLLAFLLFNNIDMNGFVLSHRVRTLLESFSRYMHSGTNLTFPRFHCPYANRAL